MNTIALVCLLTSPILFLSYTLDEFEQIKSLGMSFGMLAILGILSLSANISRIRCYWREVCKEWVCLGFLSFSASCVISTIFSVSPRTSILGNFQSFSTLLTLLSYTVLFFTLREICKNRENIKQLASIGLIGGVVTAVYMVIQFYGLDPAPWRNFASEKGLIRPFATLGHPNFASAYLVMLVPIILVTTRRLRYVLVPLFTFCIGISGSRGAWFALFSVGVTLIYGAYKLGRKRESRIALGVFSGACLIGMYFLLMVQHNEQGFTHALSTRAQSLFKLDTRYYYWKAGLQTFWKYHWFGAGLDTFQIMFNQLRTEQYWQVERFGSPHKAHNELIQVAATQGLFGLLSIGMILLGSLRSYLVSWRRSDESQRVFLLSILAGCVAYLVQALAGFNVVATGSLFVSFLAILSGYEETCYTWKRDPSWKAPTTPKQDFLPALAIGASISAIFLFLNLGSMFGTYKDNAALVAIFGILAAITLYVAWVGTNKVYLRNMACVALFTAITFRLILIPFFASVVTKVATQNTQDKKTALLVYEQAIRIDRSNEYYPSQMGYLAEQAAVEAKDPKEATELFVLGFRAFEYAARLEPLRAANWYNQALIMAELVRRGSVAQDQIKVAYPFLTKAIELEPHNPIFKGLLGNGAK